MHKFITVLFLLAMTTFAQQPTPDEVRKLLAVSGMDKPVDSFMDIKGIEKQLCSTPSRDDLPADLRARSERMCKEMGPELLKELNAMQKYITEETIKFYIRSYTAEEVRGLIAFYESPLGRKMVDLLPKLTLEIMQTSMMQWPSKVQEMLARISARIEAEEKAKQK